MSKIFEKIKPPFDKAYVLDNGNIMTPAMRMVYANLFVPGPPSKSEKDEKRFHWSLTGLIPGLVDLTALDERIKEIVADNLSEAKRKPLADGTLPYKRPILQTASRQTLAALCDDYPHCISPNAKAYKKNGEKRPAPGVIYANGKEVDEADAPDQVYDGRWFRATLNPYWYPANDGKAGVSLGLVNVQLLWNDDPVASGKPSASSEFETVDIGEDDEIPSEFE